MFCKHWQVLKIFKLMFYQNFMVTLINYANTKILLLEDLEQFSWLKYWKQNWKINCMNEINVLKISHRKIAAPRFNYEWNYTMTFFSIVTFCFAFKKISIYNYKAGIRKMNFFSCFGRFFHWWKSYALKKMFFNTRRSKLFLPRAGFLN